VSVQNSFVVALPQKAKNGADWAAAHSPDVVDMGEVSPDLAAMGGGT